MTIVTQNECCHQFEEKKMNSRYTKTAMLLHWLIALGIFSMFGLGWFMSELPKEAPEQLSYDLFNFGVFTWDLAKAATPRTFYFNFHKSIGVTILVLIVIRLLWRITHQPPALPASLKKWEVKLSKGTHHFLYLLMFAMPISGLIMAVSSKYGVKWFGIKILPGLDSETLRDVFHEAHEIIGIVLVCIVLLHIAGTLKHKFIDKNDILKRMLP